VPGDDWTSNRMTLAQGQQNYAQLGACAEAWVKACRLPAAFEERPGDWKSIKTRREEALAHLEVVLDDAFGGVLRDGGVTLHQMDVLDGYGSPADLAIAASRDPEVAWREVSDSKLMSFGMSLVFLDAKGFRFYIPAYMRLVARHIESATYSGLCGVWFALRGSAYDRERHYALLSAAQNRAIVTFLSIMRELGDPDECGDADQCLRAYWDAIP